MSREEIRAEFNRKSGEVLRIALNLEVNLDYFIATYFLKSPKNEKNFFEDLSNRRTFFEEKVLQNLNFAKKKDIFKEICKKEECDSEKIKETIDSIEFIQKIRNKIAHWHMVQTEENEPFLTNKIELANESDKFRLSSEIMSKLNDARLKTVSGILNLQLQCYMNSIDNKKSEYSNH